jgi:1-acyl-sn-glycerol-3-phosphate acyltransferase
MKRSFAFLKFLLYWLVIPIASLAIVDFYTPAHPHYWWGIFFVVTGLFWSALATSYMVIVGMGLPFFGKRAPKILVTCGPYSMSRHPIYFGYFLYTLGLSLFFNLLSLPLILVELIIIFILIPIEEKGLKKKFEEFENYKASTPLFVPTKKWHVDEAKDPPFLFVSLYMFGKFFIKFFYDVHSHGKENIPVPPFLVVANHNCYFDPFFIMDAMNVYMKAPLSWAHYEGMKWLIDRVGMFPIKRYTADSSAIMKMLRAVRHGGVVGIFVENERSWDGRPLNVKNGVDRLVKSLKVPILPVRIERAHLMWPRWASKFSKGRVDVFIGKLTDVENYEEAFEFVLKDTIPPTSTYKDYRGIETYLWRCPECKHIASLISSKKSFSCSKCGKTWVKPSVAEVRKMHDMIYPSDVSDLPIEDEALVNDEETKISLQKEFIKLGSENVEISRIKAFLVESRHEFYVYSNKLYEVHPHKTSPLMWKEWVDFLKRDDPSYWRYR